MITQSFLSADFTKRYTHEGEAGGYMEQSTAHLLETKQESVAASKITAVAKQSGS
jgi:hypothetical protein